MSLLLALGVLGVCIPYTLLSIYFEYPDILREQPGILLQRFEEGGTQLILTWWLFAVLGIPFIPAYKLLEAQLKPFSQSIHWITTIGIMGLVFQLIGLLRWTFIVPFLAKQYTHATSVEAKEAVALVFEVVHRWGGVMLGEHLGQLFTILWMFGITRVLHQLKWWPTWFTVLGYLTSCIYVVAQTELAATVIPSFPVVSWAGLVGSSLWLVWMSCLAFLLVRRPLSEMDLLFVLSTDHA